MRRRPRDRRRAVPRPPRAHQARAAVGALRPRARRRRRSWPSASPPVPPPTATTTAPTSSASATRRPCPPTPTRASCSSSTSASWPAGPTSRRARLSRDLYLRAIEVMAGADALGGFVSLTAQESFAIEYWPLELYKLSLAPAPRRAAGQGRAGHRRRGRDRPRDRRRAQRRRRVRGRLRPRRRRRARCRGGARRPRPRGARRRHREDAVAGAFAAAVERFGGVDIVVSNAGLASSAPIQDTTLEEWNRNHAVLGTGYFLVAREAFRVLERQGTRRLDRLRRLQERARGGAQRRRLLVGQGRRAAPRALPGRGGRAGGHPREHGQPRRRAQRLADLGLVVARGARRQLRHRARRARGALPRAHDAGRQHRAARTSRRPCCISPPMRGRARRRATCSTSTAACRPLTRAERRA